VILEHVAIFSFIYQRAIFCQCGALHYVHSLPISAQHSCVEISERQHWGANGCTETYSICDAYLYSNARAGEQSMDVEPVSPAWPALGVCGGSLVLSGVYPQFLHPIDKSWIEQTRFPNYICGARCNLVIATSDFRGCITVYHSVGTWKPSHCQNYDRSRASFFIFFWVSDGRLS